MAGSIAEDGSFTMDFIENMGDAHEALAEAHQLIARVAQGWATDRIINGWLEAMAFPMLSVMPVIQPELHGAASAYRKAATRRCITSKARRMPSESFADDVIEELLSRTEAGEPLTRICADKRMPNRQTVYEWIDGDESFGRRFHDARARGIHALVEETLEIADLPSTDSVAATDKRIRIDTRLRLAGKWLPSVYGDRVAHVGGDPKAGDKPIQTEARVTVYVPDNGR